jgi:hypothetical protein
MNEPPHLFPMNQIWDIVVSIEVSIPIESYSATVAEVSRLVLGAPAVVSSYHYRIRPHLHEQAAGPLTYKSQQTLRSWMIRRRKEMTDMADKREVASGKVQTEQSLIPAMLMMTPAQRPPE